MGESNLLGLLILCGAVLAFIATVMGAAMIAFSERPEDDAGPECNPLGRWLTPEGLNPVGRLGVRIVLGGIVTFVGLLLLGVAIS